MASKHIVVLPSSKENCHDRMDAMEIICDSVGLDCSQTPLMTLAMAVTSPLLIHHQNVEFMKATMSRCYPILPTVCPMAGATSPYSLAGSLLQANVETLLPVLIAQLYKPGHPVFYVVSPSVMDMNSGHDLYYKAEAAVWKIALNQMATFYNLPNSGTAGSTLTHLPDMQNGAESYALILASHALKQNLIFGLGSLGNANGMSAEQIVMQCGLIDMAEYMSRGICTSNNRWDYKSIENAGPGGNYLTDALTVENLHNKEFFTSKYMDLGGSYMENCFSMYDIAHQYCMDAVSNYKPVVPRQVVANLVDFFKKKYKHEKSVDINCRL